MNCREQFFVLFQVAVCSRDKPSEIGLYCFVCRKYVQVVVHSNSHAEFQLSDQTLTSTCADVELIPLNKPGQHWVTTFFICLAVVLLPLAGALSTNFEN